MSKTKNARRGKACPLTPAQLASRQRNQLCKTTWQAPEVIDAETSAVIGALSYHGEKSETLRKLQSAGINTSGDLGAIAGIIPIPEGRAPGEYLAQHVICVHSTFRMAAARTLDHVSGDSDPNKSRFTFTEGQWLSLERVFQRLIDQGLIIDATLGDDRHVYAVPVSVETKWQIDTWQKRMWQAFYAAGFRFRWERA